MKRFFIKSFTFFSLLAITCAAQGKVDSVEVFYEKHNSFLTFSLEDYKTQIRAQLGEKSKNYLDSFDTLVAGAKGSVLYLRNGFWSARYCYSRSDYPALEQAGYVLFKTGMARLAQQGKYFVFDDCVTAEKNFQVCKASDAANGGTELWLRSKKDGALLLSIPLTVTKEFLETAWCR